MKPVADRDGQHARREEREQAHLGERARRRVLDDDGLAHTIHKVLSTKARRDLGAKGVVEVLQRLVRLVGRHEELGALEEHELGVEVSSLKDGTVGRLRMTSFASDLGRLEPELGNLVASRLGDSAEAKRGQL